MIGIIELKYQSTVRVLELQVAFLDLVIMSI